VNALKCPEGFFIVSELIKAFGVLDFCGILKIKKNIIIKI